MTISLKADPSGNFGSILINGTEAIRVNPNGIPAQSIGFTPSGNIAASNVQAALQEVDTETQAGLATKVSKSGDTMTGGLTTTGLSVGSSGNAGISQKGTGITSEGTIELYGPSPFVDFKTTAVDYRYRIILQDDNLQIHAPIGGAFRVGASGECYSSLTANAADALTRKDYVDGQIASRPFADNCVAVGFNGGNVADPYIKHANQTIVQVMKSCNNAGWLGMSTGNRCEFHWNNGLYAQVDGSTGWLAIQNSLGSDRRLKEPVGTEKTQSGLATVMALNPVYFEYKENSLAPKPGARWGFYAQELQEINPSLVTTGKIPEDETEYLFYAEDGLAQLIAIQTRAIQELSTKLDSAMAEIAALKAAK